MGGALIHGWCKAGLASELTITARTQSTLERFSSLYPEITTTTSNSLAIEGADVVILAVKPWLVEEVIDQIKEPLRATNPLLVSVAAGVRNARINVYAMSNIAVQYQTGMTFIEEPERNTAPFQEVARLFSLVGKVQIVPHKDMDAGMQLSGCGIAYVMRYVRAMMEGGVELGLRPDEAKQAVLQTMKGAISILEESGKHPEEAIDCVTTPGGYTIRGLNAMEEAGFTRSVLVGLKANNKE